MPAAQSQVADDTSIVEHYLTARRAAGRRTGKSTIQAAHTCQAKIHRAGGWGGLTAEQQLDAVVKARSFTSWLMVTGRITVDAELLSRSDLRPGLPARSFCAADYRWFTETCSRIGVSSRDTAAQWNILAKVTAITGASPRAVTDEDFDAARLAMATAYAGRGKPTAGKNVAAVFHRLRLGGDPRRPIGGIIVVHDADPLGELLIGGLSGGSGIGGSAPGIKRRTRDLNDLAQPLHLEGVPVVGDEPQAAHQFVSPAKYLAADRRMSRSVANRVFSARSRPTSARNRASSCSGVCTPAAGSVAAAGLRCRIGTPAALHHADSVTSLTPSSTAICVIVAPSVSR
jgi:hypothetical protein